MWQARAKLGKTPFPLNLTKLVWEDLLSSADKGWECISPLLECNTNIKIFILKKLYQKIQKTSVYSSSYKVSKLAYIHTFVINVLSKYIYVIRLKREWINDDSTGCHIFLQGNYMCLYMKLETRLPVGFPDIIEQQVRKLSLLEIRQNRGHKPLLI